LWNIFGHWEIEEAQDGGRNSSNSERTETSDSLVYHWASKAESAAASCGTGSKECADTQEQRQALLIRRVNDKLRSGSATVPEHPDAEGNWTGIAEKLEIDSAAPGE
jgi:hypothetical protein